MTGLGWLAVARGLLSVRRMPIPLRQISIALALTTTACTAGLSLGGRASGGASSGSTASSGPSSNGGGGGGGASNGDSSLAGGDSKASTPTTKFSDFGWEVKDATGEYTSGWIIDKLTTFNVGPACMEKMVDKNNSAVHSATFYTRDIAELAQKLTGDDWDRIESQNNNDRENNKKLVEPMIDKFSQSFHLSITVDGDDCDTRHGALWLKYWTQISDVLTENPPASGKVFVQLAVRGDAKDVKVEVNDDTSTYSITAPRDIEPTGWSDKLEKPFRKRARQK
jgi:hypothetical protein